MERRKKNGCFSQTQHSHPLFRGDLFLAWEGECWPLWQGSHWLLSESDLENSISTSNTCQTLKEIFYFPSTTFFSKPGTRHSCAFINSWHFLAMERKYCYQTHKQNKPGLGMFSFLSFFFFLFQMISLIQSYW